MAKRLGVSGLVERHGPDLGIGAGRPTCLGGAVAHRNLGNVRASFLNDAAGLGAEAAWQRSRLLA